MTLNDKEQLFFEKKVALCKKPNERRIWLMIHSCYQRMQFEKVTN